MSAITTPIPPALPPALTDLHLLSGLMTTTPLTVWQERITRESPTFDPFSSYCSRTGAVVGKLTDAAIQLLIQIAESLHEGDTEAQLIHLQNTALRHMKPAPAWSYLTPAILKLLGEQDPYGTATYLCSLLFRRASLKTSDSLDRNEWLLRLRAKLDSAPIPQIREINALLFGLDARAGLANVRRPKDFDLENPIATLPAFLDHLRREYTLASNPSPHDASRHYWQLQCDKEESELTAKGDSLTSSLRGDFALPLPTPKERRAQLQPEFIEKKKRQSRNVSIDNAIALSILKGFGADSLNAAVSIRQESQHSVPQSVVQPAAPKSASFAELLAKSQATQAAQSEPQK